MPREIRCIDGSIAVDDRMTIEEWVAHHHGADAKLEGLALSEDGMIATISFPESVFPFENVRIRFVSVERDVSFRLSQVTGGKFMKIYSADRDKTGTRIFVRSGTDTHEHTSELTPARSQALVNHSPNGFEWSYSGSGPSQLALAILLDIFNDEALALLHHQDFKTRFIANVPVAKLEIREDDVRQWIENANKGVLL